MKISKYPIIALIIFLASATNCFSQVFTVTNQLDIARDEIVGIVISNINPAISPDKADSIWIREDGSREAMILQFVDNDADRIPDEILFRAVIGPRETKKYIIETAGNKKTVQQKESPATFSRLVPERQNDYAWENDRVGFRFYGAPSGTTNPKPNGGGIDAFMKRVSYPVLNKWYKNNAEKEGAYHIDTGEGYDPYQVGASRGIGGIGIWDKDSLYVSGSFIGSKTIASGPLRTIFELTFAPWDANGRKITEVKRVSLDLGSHLSRITEMITSEREIQNVVAGITLHDKKGEVKVNIAEGWYRYWEPMDDSWLGTAIVANPEIVTAYKDYRTTVRDQSHLLVFTKPLENTVTFYAGYAWQKSGHFKTARAWDDYLTGFSKRLRSPLVVRFK